MLLNDTAQLPNRPRRIISLVPSVTELLHYLGLNEETVAVTKFCIHPAEWFRSKKNIGGTKNINIRRIKELAPDLIIASKEENVQEQVEELAAAHNVWLIDVNSIDDAHEMIKDIGMLTGKSAEAKKLVIDIKKEFGRLQLHKRVAKAAYLIWRTPFMTVGGGTFINDMMQYCGFENVFAKQLRYPKITTAELEASGCSLVLLASEPYPFKEKHIKELQQYLPGVKIILADGEMFSWYGSRMLLMPQYMQSLIKTAKSQ
jgi:ABC-type Fe3+-hydroxamate transport system substrate-binding protein